jgi:hypothetical protein
VKEDLQSAVEAMPVTRLPIEVVLTFDTFLIIGCYAFMWSVRHPKMNDREVVEAVIHGVEIY